MQPRAHGCSNGPDRSPEAPDALPQRRRPLPRRPVRRGDPGRRRPGRLARTGERPRRRRRRRRRWSTWTGRSSPRRSSTRTCTCWRPASRSTVWSLAGATPGAALDAVQRPAGPAVLGPGTRPRARVRPAHPAGARPCRRGGRWCSSRGPGPAVGDVPSCAATTRAGVLDAASAVGALPPDALAAQVPGSRASEAWPPRPRRGRRASTSTAPGPGRPRGARLAHRGDGRPRVGAAARGRLPRGAVRDRGRRARAARGRPGSHRHRW